MSKLIQKMPWPELLLAAILGATLGTIMGLVVFPRVTMGAALTSSDTSAPYANGDQRIQDLTTLAAGQVLTVPNRSQQAVIQAIGGTVYFAHDGNPATALDFQIAAGGVFIYDGDLGNVYLLAAGANTHVNILYFR